MASIFLLPRALARPTEADYATLSSAWAMCYCSTAKRTPLQDAITKLACYPLATRSLDLKRGENSLPALIIFVAAIASTAVGLVSIQLALGLACVAMVLRSIVPVRELYDGVDWPVVVLLGALIPLGSALETTGATQVLVGGILNVAGDYSPVLLLTLILVVTMTVSDVLNNAATAILMAPIAYSIATTLGHNPRHVLDGGRNRCVLCVFDADWAPK